MDNRFKKEFPIISSIKMQKTMDKTLEIFIEAHSCKALLNNELCVSYEGPHYPLQQFAQESLAPIPSITTTENTESFKKFLKIIDEEILKNYTITWNSPHEIYLTPQGKKFCIKTCTDNLPTKKLLDTIHLLYEQIPKNRMLDTRFKGQIIVCSNRGEK